MPVRFQCPHCLSRLTVSRKFAGRRGRCPNCKSRVTVPEITIHDPSGAIESDSFETPDIHAAPDPSPENDSIRASETASAAGRPTRKNKSLLSERIQIPRWAVYTQGVLLGLIATTFFVFGLAVGNTTGVGATDEDTGTCVITGAVYFDQGQERRADRGAVVIFLPADAQPRQRPDASGLRPDRFEPVRNAAMDEIRGLGGCVVRADQDGKFEAELNNNKSYWWLVISKNQRAPGDSIGKQTRAELGTWFLPIEDLLGDREFMWDKVRISGSEQTMQVVTF